MKQRVLLLASLMAAVAILLPSALKAQCNAPSGLAANGSPTGAVITWTSGGIATTGYTVEYRVYGDDTWTPAGTTTNTYFILSGLTPQTRYEVQVAATCGSDQSDFVSTAFFSNRYECSQYVAGTVDTIVTGTGTNYNYGVPVNSSWGNSFCETIFTSEELAELGLNGTINALSLYFTAQTSSYYKSITIMMGVVDEENFSSGSPIDPNDLTVVYNTRNLDVSVAGEQMFYFDIPFVYDTTKNLIVATFINQREGMSHSSSGFYGYSSMGNSSCTYYAYQDNTAFNFSNYTSGNHSTSSYRPSYTFYQGECEEYSTCAAPAVAASYLGSDTVTLVWAPGGNEGFWEVYYRETTSSTYILAGSAYQNEMTITGLTPGTLHHFQVRHECNNEEYIGEFQAFTQCAPMPAIYMDFEAYPTGSTAEFDFCWEKHYTSGTSYPYVTTSMGQKGMYFYSYQSSTGTPTTSWLVFPPTQGNITGYEIEFDAATNNSSAYNVASIVVGSMTNTDDFSTFDTIAVFENLPYYYWEPYYTTLDSYTGGGTNIVLACTAHPIEGYTYAYNYAVVDNIKVRPINACRAPQKLHSREVTASTADIVWTTDEDNYTEIKLRWGTSGDMSQAIDSLTISDDNIYTITGLQPNTTYYCWASATCNDGDDSYISSCSFTTFSECGTIENLTASTVSYNKIAIQWDANEVAPATSYTVAWKADTTDVWDTATTTNTYYFIDGLDQGVTYNIEVTANCNENVMSDADYLDITTLSETMVGRLDGTYYLPMNVYYHYSISEQVWTAEELADYDTVINGIYFYLDHEQNEERHVYIWVANSSLSNITSENNIPSNRMTLVHDDMVQLTAGWLYFPFETPFHRNPDSNFVVLVYDSTGSYMSSDYFYAYNSDIQSIYRYRDGTPYSSTDLSELTTANVRAAMRLDANHSAVTCAGPIAAVVSTDDESISIAWQSALGNPSFSVEYAENDSDEWTVAEASTTETELTINGLNSSTQYQIRIIALCGEEQRSTTLLATTECSTFIVPYCEDFEEATSTYDFHPCWNMGNRSELSEASISNISEIGKMMLMPVGSYVILPQMNQPTSELQLRFQALTAQSSYIGIVGVCSHPNDLLSMRIIDTIRIDEPGVPIWKTVTFESCNEYENYITILSPNGSIYIDNINVEPIATCGTVTSITAENITASSISVTWSPIAGASAYNVYCRKVSDGTTVQNTVSDTACTFNGLDHSSLYDITIITSCTENDSSTISNRLRVSTSCQSITLPYFENFDSYNPPALTYTGKIPTCWQYGMLASGTYATGNYLPQLYRNSTYAHSGSTSLLLYGTTIVTLPEMPTDVDSLMISFYEYNSSPNYYGLIIGVCDSNTPGFEESFVPVDTLICDASGINHHFSYMFLTYPGNGRYIAFRNFYINSSASYSMHYIDDITVDYAPNCVPPYRLTASTTSPTSVDLAWTDLRPATDWEVSYGISPMTDPSTGTIVSCSTNPVTINGLSSSNLYDFYVRTVCDINEQSDWSTPISKRPGSYDMRANQTDTITMCGGSIFDDGGETGSYSASQNSTLVVMPTNEADLIQVSGTTNTESSFDYITIYQGIGTGGEVLFTDQGTTNYGAFGPFLSIDGPITIYFHTDGSVQYAGFQIDVECIPNPCPIVDLHIDSATHPFNTQTATVAWNSTSTSYLIEWGHRGFTLGSGTTATTTSNFYTLTNLDRLTAYDFYVTALCNEGDTGITRRFSFTTPMCDGATAYENFDSTDASSTSNYGPIGYSYYNYSYVQTLIDASTLASLDGDIEALAFMPANTTASSYFDHMTVFLANVSENDLDDDFIFADSAHHFVKVINDADFSYEYQDEWIIHGFDTNFTWDGHSNVLVAIARSNGSYYSGAQFHSHQDSVIRFRYAYNDYDPYDPMDEEIEYTIYDNSNNYSYNVGNLQLISCGQLCPAPDVVSIDSTYNTISLTWANSDSTELLLCQGQWDEEAAIATLTSSNGNTTFTGLEFNSPYIIGLRTLCENDLTSDWVILYHNTADLPCFAPSAPTVTSTLFTSASFSWTPGGIEQAWQVHVYNSAFELIDTVTSPAYTVNGLTPGTSYNIAVSALCGTQLELASEESETTQFTTDACQPVANVNVSNITNNTATVTWTASSNGTGNYTLEYGYRGINRGEGTSINTSSTSYNLTGLDQNVEYDVYVQAICTDGQTSTWSEVKTFQTTNESQGIDDILANQVISLYPNPATTTVIVSTTLEGAAQIAILDMNGRTVATSTIADGHATLDVSSLAQGAYFVRITSNDMSAIRKLIVR